MPRSFLQFPVIAAGAEYLVMGNLMRRNILTYKAPPGNEGYDLICIHPDPRHRPQPGELPQVRVQVKSRYGTQAREFPVKEVSIDAFDFLIATFLNIDNFGSGHDGSTGERAPEFFTLPSDFIQKHHHRSGGWERVSLRGIEQDQLAFYKDEAGFELIASALGIPRPARLSLTDATEREEDGGES